MLVQRDEQLGQLRAAFRACEEHQRGHVVLVTGAVGSGKTSLLEAFGEWAASVGGQVLTAAGSRAERRLKLGVLGQLLHSARLDQEAARRVEWLIRDTAFVDALPEPGADATDDSPDVGHGWAPLLHGLFTTLHDLTRNGPLVLAADDVHLADPASLHCLLYVTRRLRHARIMVVLAEASTVRPPHPLFRAELLSQPHLSRITLRPLTVDGIARLFSTDSEAPAAREAAERYASATGGNPVLIRALLDEHARGGTGDDRSLDPGGTDAFEQAILGCLYRHEPGVRQVAQALAVLNRPASTELLGQLLDLAPESVIPAIQVLRTSGLMGADQLRHPRILRSILTDLGPEQRRALHQRAGELLREHGVEASVVAEHLVAAGWAGSSWAVPVLQEAAACALAAGRPDTATACLRLVGRTDASDEQRSAVAAMLIQARWQVNPLAANGQLTELVESARATGWSTATALSTVPYLLWQGRVEEAAEAVDAISRDGEPDQPGGGGRLRAMQLLVSLAYPDHLAHLRETPSLWSRTAVAPSSASPSLQAVTVLGAALIPTTGHDPVASAEQLLQPHHTDDGVLGRLAAPMLAMLWSGRADRVAVWGKQLLHRQAIRHTPVARAVTRAILAEAALRLGDLPGAERSARAALEDLPPSAWGVAVAAPLATLIAGASEAGRIAEADHWLAHSVPAGIYRTPLGMLYLAARARHHLAMGRPQPAMADLRRCGEQLRSWGIDVAGLVPWRLDLARVQLSVGNNTQATQLLQEQLRQPHGVDARTRGRSLRLLAGTAAPYHRRKLLSEAVNLLQSCGDRLELARALGDTGHTLQHTGDSVRARLLARRAHQLAQDCGASVPAQRFTRRELSGAPPAHLTGVESPEPDDGLSEAERRVAALAAQGYTNRQISSKLFITVSTVEQHLTRVYKKLDVKGRTGLSTRLIAQAEALVEEAQLAI